MNLAMGAHLHACRLQQQCSNEAYIYISTVYNMTSESLFVFCYSSDF